MAVGNGDQIEKNLDYIFDSKRGIVQHSHKFDKQIKTRKERRRAKQNPECQPEYKRFHGWGW